jgi:hypothetical protein
LGNLTTPNSVQKLQTALHAKAKAELGYRFYALYDKISREDILAHAYGQCRSNKGAPGVDRQDFEAVEAYGVERWLGEEGLQWPSVALALKRSKPSVSQPIDSREKISGFTLEITPASRTCSSNSSSGSTRQAPPERGHSARAP